MNGWSPSLLGVEKIPSKLLRCYGLERFSLGWGTGDWQAARYTFARSVCVQGAVFCNIKLINNCKGNACCTVFRETRMASGYFARVGKTMWKCSVQCFYAWKSWIRLCFTLRTAFNTFRKNKKNECVLHSILSVKIRIECMLLTAIVSNKHWLDEQWGVFRKKTDMLIAWDAMVHESAWPNGPPPGLMNECAFP